MKRLISLKRQLWTIVFVLMLTSSFAWGQNENGHVYVIPLQGEVGVAMEQFVSGALATAQDDDQLSGIIFVIDTYGGRVDAAERISEMITGLQIPTASYVNPRAISAGVLVAISADTVTMAPGSNIGSAETIPDTEKALSAWTGVLRSVAQEKGRNPELVAAMADQRIEIDGITTAGQLLNMTAAEAFDADLSDLTARGLQEVLHVMEMPNASLIEMEVSRAFKMAQVLTSAYVAPILLSVGFVGLLIEVFTAGFGFGGTASFVAFALYFGGSILAGNAGTAVLLVFLAGIILLLIEAFAPGFGFPGIGGILLIVISIVMASSSITSAVVSLTISLAASVIALFVILKYAPKSKYFDRLTLATEMRTDLGYVSTEGKEALIGKEGIVISYLHPAGTVDIEGEKVDAVSEGMYVETGTRVKVIRREGRRIVVKKVD
ncbi:NfeD family protein [Anoxynatronum sibiricum]|uniref:NfeD family protein n=1 Tax=Anoxynatronum sibiricum TaxID=210623 RepID=A0ABU9VRW6_9CLOT